MAVSFPGPAETYRRYPVTLTFLLAVGFGLSIYFKCEYENGGDWSAKHWVDQLGDIFLVYFIFMFATSMLELWAGRIVKAVALEVAKNMGDVDPKLETLPSGEITA